MDWEVAHGLKKSLFCCKCYIDWQHINRHLFESSFDIDHFWPFRLVRSGQRESSSLIVNKALQHINQYYFERLFWPMDRPIDPVVGPLNTLDAKLGHGAEFTQLGQLVGPLIKISVQSDVDWYAVWPCWLSDCLIAFDHFWPVEMVKNGRNRMNFQ